MKYLENPRYSPNVLLNRVLEMHSFPSDAALARKLQITTSYLSKVRSKGIPMGDRMLLRLHDLTGLPAKELRRMMGVGE